MDRFSSLPNEILDLIAKEIPNYKSLFSLTLVSRNCYGVFNRGLYHSVSLDGQLRTLALSQGQRLPLTHPASFVKVLQIGFSRPYDPEPTDTELQVESTREEVFKREAASVLKNLDQHAVTLRSLFLYFPQIPLHQVIRNVDSAVFGDLRDLVLLVQSDILNTPSLDIFVSSEVNHTRQIPHYSFGYRSLSAKDPHL